METMLERSYISVKKFIYHEIARLNKPLVYDDALRSIVESDEGGHLSHQEMEQILDKVNQEIKNHNRKIFPAAIVNRVVDQVLQCEQDNILVARDQIAEKNNISQPVALPKLNEINNSKENIDKFGALIQDLPMGEDLLKGSREKEERLSEDDEGDQTTPSDQEEGNIESMPNRSRDRLVQKEKFSSNTREDFQLYDDVRLRLLELHKRLEYKHEKLEYLTQLKERLTTLTSTPSEYLVDRPKEPQDQPMDSDEDQDNKETDNFNTSDIAISERDKLAGEITKFRILVDKVAFKLDNQIQT